MYPTWSRDLNPSGASYHHIPSYDLDSDSRREVDPECPPSPPPHAHKAPTQQNSIYHKIASFHSLFLSTSSQSVWASLPQPLISQKRPRILYRLCTFALLILACVACIILASGVLDPFIGPDFVFDKALKPFYIGVDTTTGTKAENGNSPLVIRLTIISRVDAFERRQAIRESVLDGVSREDVTLEYRFFVGMVPLPPSTKSVAASSQNAHEEEMRRRIMRKIDRENEVYGDVVVLKDVEDIPERVAQKRFAALQWANEIPKEKYDYAMTIDSDTFCRFSTLARRMRHETLYSGLRPREENILVGRMSTHQLYWENTFTQDRRHTSRNTNRKNMIVEVEEDNWVTGPAYPYPIGIGYMLSSHLTAILLKADPALPHHIHYPYDDVMIGSWIAGLKILHDPSATFYPQSQDRSAQLVHGSVHLRPYLSYQVNTTVVDDKIGWHDYKRRGSVAHAVGWKTVCVHRMTPEEMKRFRKMEEVKMEWDY